MIGYDTYEGLIIERLVMPNVEVSALPLTDDLNIPRAVVKPRIYVIFTGSTFEDTPHLGEFTQDETLNFELYIQARTRHGEDGIFAVAEEAIQRLMKWRPKDATQKIIMTTFGYVTGIQNNWQYVLKFSFPRVRIMREDIEDYILIKKIEMKDLVTIQKVEDEEIQSIEP